MASLSGEFNLQEFSDAGALLVGGRLYTYVQGTTTQKNAYTDIAGAVPHTYTSDGLGGQYIGLNARGELPAPLYLASGAYDISLKRADGSTVWTRRADGTAGATDLAASSGAGLVGNGGETVADSFNALQLADYVALRAYSGPRKSVYVTGYLITAAPSGIAGMFIRDDNDTTTTDNGGTTIVAANGKRWKRVFSDEVNPEWFGCLHDGTTDDTTAMQAAINTGRVVSPPKGNYLLSSITLNSRAPIIAEGRSQVTFTSKTGSGAAGMVVLPVGPTIYSGIEGVAFVGAGAGNVGQHCWYFNAQASLSSPFDGGIWYSIFKSCTISGFDGHCIWLRAGPSNFLLPIQFNTFDKIYALRASNSTSRSLLMTGQVQSNTFGDECQFDGVAKGTGTNLEISREFQNGATFGGVSVGGAAVGDNAPGPNTFDEIISQNCSLAVLVDRAYNNRFNGPYFEACDKVYDQSTTAHGNVIEEPNVQNCGYDGAGGGFYFRNGGSSSMLVIGGTYSTATLDKFAIDTSSQHGLRYDGVPKFLNNDVILAATKSDGYTTGLTGQLSVSGAGALNLFTANPGATTYLVNTSATNVTAINATVMPGSQLFLRSLSGSVTYATGGNIALGAAASVVVGAGSVAHFVRFDLGTNWVLVSVTP